MKKGTFLLLVTLQAAFSGLTTAQTCPPVMEMPSGPTFRVSNDPGFLFNWYAWLAVDPAFSYNLLGLSLGSSAESVGELWFG